jgi:hypothetical protein
MLGTSKSSSGQNYIKITVCDTGVGIPTENRHPFGTSLPSSMFCDAELWWSGLGLAIVKALVKMMSGSVSLESEPERGSSFTVLIPFEVLTPYTPAATFQKELAGTSAVFIGLNEREMQMYGALFSAWGVTCVFYSKAFDFYKALENEQLPKNMRTMFLDEYLEDRRLLFSKISANDGDVVKTIPESVRIVVFLVSAGKQILPGVFLVNWLLSCLGRQNESIFFAYYSQRICTNQNSLIATLK